MQTDSLTHDFEPEKRVALAWTPSPQRESFATLLALDRRLARIVSQATEPMLAQIRLAWWRDELAKPPEMRPTGDAVLDAIGVHWRGEEASLSTLVDGWELLLVEPPIPEHVARDFVASRAEPFAGLAQLGGIADGEAARRAGTVWAATDASLHASDEAERALFAAMAREIPVPRLPGELRGVSVLAGLGARSAQRDDPALMHGRGGALAALRLGIFGR